MICVSASAFDLFLRLATAAIIAAQWWIGRQIRKKNERLAKELHAAAMALRIFSNLKRSNPNNER